MNDVFNQVKSPLGRWQRLHVRGKSQLYGVAIVAGVCLQWRVLFQLGFRPMLEASVRNQSSLFPAWFGFGFGFGLLTCSYTYYVSITTRFGRGGDVAQSNGAIFKATGFHESDWLEQSTSTPTSYFNVLGTGSVTSLNELKWEMERVSTWLPSSYFWCHRFQTVCNLTDLEKVGKSRDFGEVWMRWWPPLDMLQQYLRWGRDTFLAYLHLSPSGLQHDVSSRI